MISEIASSQENEPRDKKYLQYAAGIYQELIEFTESKNLNREFVAIMMDKMVAPYVYWKDDGSETATVQGTQGYVSREDRVNGPESESKAYLEALKRKYNLIEEDGNIKPKTSLPKNQFKELAEKLQMAGFRYKEGKFRREVL